MQHLNAMKKELRFVALVTFVINDSYNNFVEFNI